MPTVAMPDGTQVQMPDKLDAGLAQRLKAFDAAGGKPAPMSDLPFKHQVGLASMDNPAEKQAYLEKAFGKENISQDRKGFVVTQNGKRMRADSGFFANMASEAPETVLGIAGGVEGGLAGAAVGGPVGAVVGGVVGAAGGAAAGKDIKEIVKGATGVQKKTGEQFTKSIEGAAAGGAIGEVTGRVGGLAVKAGGRAWRWLAGTTHETAGATARYIKGGARPIPQFTLPDAKAIQRIYTIAEKISGPSKGMEAANKKYMMGEVAKVLDKAGMSSAAKEAVSASLEGTGSKISVTEAGRLVQTTAKMMKGQGKTKAEKYLVSLMNGTPESAYTRLVHGNSVDMLDRFVRTMGKNSAVVEAIQHQALKDLLAESMIRTKDKGVVDSLSRGLKGMTDKQKELLFPNGLAKRIGQLDKDLHQIFPGGMDVSAASITAGALLQRPLLGKIIHGGDRTRIFHSRLAAYAYYGTMRLMLQQPSIMTALAVGLGKGGAKRAATKTALKELVYLGTIEGGEAWGNDEQQQQQQGQPQQ